VTRTQYYTATSIDGFIADEDNSLEWLFTADRDNPDAPEDGAANRFDDFFAGVGAMCMGATTYEWVLDHDTLLENPQKWSGYYGTTPCWVFTHRDLPAIPGADITFVRGDVAPVHAAMTAAAGGRNIWVVGGGELVGLFHDQGLLDDVFLGIAPVFLGGGAPLLPRHFAADVLELVDMQRLGGFVNLHYRVRH
jgi:dihydrofolate reductase